MSDSMTTQGIILQMNNVDVPEVHAIKAPGADRADIDVTNLIDAWKKFKKGVMDGGEITFDVHIDPSNATHAELFVQHASDDPTNWKIIYARAGNWTASFKANLTKLDPTAHEVDGKAVFNCRAKVTGEVTWS